MFYFDPVYMLILAPCFLLAGLASMKVKSSFNKFSRYGVSSGLSGAEAARRMLDSEGLTHVRVEQTNGYLSDHYNPATQTLALSPQVYAGRSIAAVGVACHEAGHAFQHAKKYPMLGFRSAIVPAANLGSWLSFPMMAFGVMLNFYGLALLGLIAFSALVVFQLITLPVEFDATKRAKEFLPKLGIISGRQEAAGVASVLDAAALTYVAATVAAIAQLLYFAWRLGLIGGRND